jgi:hypothetical protein
MRLTKQQRLYDAPRSSHQLISIEFHDKQQITTFNVSDLGATLEKQMRSKKYITLSQLVFSNACDLKGKILITRSPKKTGEDSCMMLPVSKTMFHFVDTFNCFDNKTHEMLECGLNNPTTIYAGDARSCREFFLMATQFGYLRKWRASVLCYPEDTRVFNATLVLFNSLSQKELDGTEIKSFLTYITNKESSENAVAVANRWTQNMHKPCVIEKCSYVDEQQYIVIYAVIREPDIDFEEQ